MNIQQPKIDLKNNFELYLEGIKVDFLSITISETEGGIPAASITFPSNQGALRILPGTIVQVFGYYHIENKSFLLFEGEITGINLQKSDSSKVVVVKAISLLGSMIKAKFRPADALLTKELKDSTGVQGTTSVIYNNKKEDASVGPTTVEDFNNIKNEKSTTITGTSKDIGLTAVFGLVDEFQKMLSEDQPGGKGDFIPMLQQFNVYFENNDLFYGLRSLAYKFGRSIFASPNPELLNKVKVDLFNEALNKLQSSGISDIFGEAPYTLMQIMTEFQRYLHYNFISPANYTACRPFYVEGVTNNWEPLRITYLPLLLTGPPALCNVFFPEQISSYTYSREMMAEPTRVIGKATVPLLNPINKVIDYSPTAVYPSLEFDTDLAVGNFTTEETYRGINYKIVSYTNLQSDVVSKVTTETSNGKKSTKNRKMNADDMEKGEIGYLIRPFAYIDYLNMRYEQRVTSINAEWSPYRMIGLPGLILDSDGFSIIGVLQSIETTISAQGQASTRIQLRGTRLVYDDDFEQTVFSKIPTDNPEGLEKYVIHDLTNDGMMSTNELLYNQDLYSFENIGRDVYTYITNGMLSANDGFLTAKNNYNIFSYTGDKLKNINFEFPVHPRIDNSVLHYLPKKGDAYSFDIPESYSTKTEIKNTYLLYKAIKELRKDYESKKYKFVNGEKQYDMQQAYNFMYAINRRNVITKESYFSFIGGNPNRKYQIEDAHDAKTIFADGAMSLRQFLLDNINEQYVKIIDSSNAQEEILKNKLKRLNQDLINKKKDRDNVLNSGYYTDQDYLEKTVLVEYDTEIQNIENQIESINGQLSQLKTTEKMPSSEVKEDELYKPYNLTRRMHVIYAFKDVLDIVVDYNKSKLTVTK